MVQWVPKTRAHGRFSETGFQESVFGTLRTASAASCAPRRFLPTNNRFSDVRPAPRRPHQIANNPRYSHRHSAVIAGAGTTVDRNLNGGAAAQGTRTMAENVTNELILDHLKAIHSRLSTIEGRLQSLGTDMHSLKGHMAGILQA